MSDFSWLGQGPPSVRRELLVEFWSLIGSGLDIENAAPRAGFSATSGRSYFRQAGGVNPRLKTLSGRYLSFAERELIGIWVAEKTSVREIARRLGRAPSTISRELERNRRVHGRGPRRNRMPYLASIAQDRTRVRSRRPKPRKLVSNPDLAAYVAGKLGSRQRWSPEQISAKVALDFPHDRTMRVSHETIYQALYVQGRGGLRRDLAACLRTGRAVRQPNRRQGQRRARVPAELLISERPAEVEDRAVPGHWEGDLIVGKDNATAIGTLVERTTRYTMLLHLPRLHDAAAVRDAMAQVIPTLPQHLWRSLTWDQGSEMIGAHAEIKIAAGLPIYFCDPHSPWQRGSNENTNGLLRQYFPKSTDLSVHSAHDLAETAAALNGRPRKTLNWRTPAEALAELISSPIEPSVATTP